MDWLNDHAWAGWLSAAIALGVVEVFSLDLVFAMLAVGALVGMVSSALGAALIVSFLLAVGTAGATLFVLRPPLIKRLHSGPDLQMSHGRLIGTQGLATTRISGVETGQVRLAGELWSAAPYDDTVAIEPGDTVEVLEIRGATAYVHPVPRLDP